MIYTNNKQVGLSANEVNNLVNKLVESKQDKKIVFEGQEMLLTTALQRVNNSAVGKANIIDAETLPDSLTPNSQYWVKTYNGQTIDNGRYIILVDNLGTPHFMGESTSVPVTDIQINGSSIVDGATKIANIRPKTVIDDTSTDNDIPSAKGVLDLFKAGSGGGGSGDAPFIFVDYDWCTDGKDHYSALTAEQVEILKNPNSIIKVKYPGTNNDMMLQLHKMYDYGKVDTEGFTIQSWIGQNVRENNVKSSNPVPPDTIRGQYEHIDGMTPTFKFAIGRYDNLQQQKDTRLNTTNKTVVGAINEVYASVSSGTSITTSLTQSDIGLTGSFGVSQFSAFLIGDSLLQVSFRMGGVSTLVDETEIASISNDTYKPKGDIAGSVYLNKNTAVKVICLTTGKFYVYSNSSLSNATLYVSFLLPIK